MAIREATLAGLSREQLLDMHYQMVAHPPLRGEGRRGILARQDRRLPAPLHRAGGERRRRLLRAAPGRLRRQQLTASTATPSSKAWSRRR